MVLVLAGIVVSTLFQAFISITQYVANPVDTLPTITFWLMGGLTTLDEAKLAPVAAVKDKRIYPMPIAAHIWGNRTSEQPLSVAFAASKMYPEKLTQDHLKRLTHRFYKDAYHHELTDAQVDEILAGM